MSNERDKAQEVLDAIEGAVEVVYEKVMGFLDNVRENIDALDTEDGSVTVESMLNDLVGFADSYEVHDTVWHTLSPNDFNDAESVASLAASWDELPEEHKSTAKENENPFGPKSTDILNGLKNLGKNFGI